MQDVLDHHNAFWKCNHFIHKIVIKKELEFHSYKIHRDGHESSFNLQTEINKLNVAVDIFEIWVSAAPSVLPVQRQLSFSSCVLWSQRFTDGVNAIKYKVCSGRFVWSVKKSVWRCYFSLVSFLRSVFLCHLEMKSQIQMQGVSVFSLVNKSLQDRTCHCLLTWEAFEDNWSYISEHLLFLNEQREQEQNDLEPRSSLHLLFCSSVYVTIISFSHRFFTFHFCLSSSAVTSSGQLPSVALWRT